jgi:tetratricopeptide (TPR) repeat protein
MTERDEDHRFSEGEGFDDSYEGFDLDPPELSVDPATVDPVDSHVVPDLLDEHHVTNEMVDVDELVDVGLSYMQINRFEQAAEAFERAARFADDGSDVEQEAWTNKGVAHAELQEYDAAIGAYREAIDVAEGGEHAATAHTNLAYAYWEHGQDERAFEHAERAVELDDRSPQAWYNRGFILLERGLSEDALSSLENAIRLGFRSAEVFEEKARALEELGEHDEAEEAAERAEDIRKEAERQLIQE